MTKKPPPLENSIVKSITEFLKNIPECRCVKTHGSLRRQGEPDLYIVHRGQFYAIEVKRPGNKATRLQEATLAKWEQAGAVTGVAYSRDDVKRIMGMVEP